MIGLVEMMILIDFSCLRIPGSKEYRKLSARTEAHRPGTA